MKQNSNTIILSCKDRNIKSTLLMSLLKVMKILLNFYFHQNQQKCLARKHWGKSCHSEQSTRNGDKF